MFFVCLVGFLLSQRNIPKGKCFKQFVAFVVFAKGRCGLLLAFVCLMFVVEVVDLIPGDDRNTFCCLVMLPTCVCARGQNK